MIYNVCGKCGLTLPNSYLQPIIFVDSNGRKKKTFLCTRCKSELAQRKANNE